MLDAFVESIESVDEALRGEYKQVEGGFQLDVKPTNGFALENVEGLKSALGKERNSVSSLTKEINKIKKEFDGIDPVELIGTKAQLDDLQKKYPIFKAARYAHYNSRNEKDFETHTFLNQIAPFLIFSFLVLIYIFFKTLLERFLCLICIVVYNFGYTQRAKCKKKPILLIWYSSYLDMKIPKISHFLTC